MKIFLLFGICTKVRTYQRDYTIRVFMFGICCPVIQLFLYFSSTIIFQPWDLRLTGIIKPANACRVCRNQAISQSHLLTANVIEEVIIQIAEPQISKCGLCRIISMLFLLIEIVNVVIFAKQGAAKWFVILLQKFPDQATVLFIRWHTIIYGEIIL